MRCSRWFSITSIHPGGGGCLRAAMTYNARVKLWTSHWPAPARTRSSRASNQAGGGGGRGGEKEVGPCVLACA
eukprot:229844-Pelagomonas_calceolata.AAC.1